MEINLRENILLKLGHPDHADALYHAVEQGREHLMIFLPWIPFMNTVEDFSRYLKNVQSLSVQGLDYSFNIFDEDAIIGRVGLHYINKPNKTANIGYWLLPDRQGKGLITDAVRIIINIGFDNFDLNRLEIKAAVQNKRSRAIPERLGFQFEGVLRQAELIHGHYHDLALYSFLKDDLTK